MDTHNKLTLHSSLNSLTKINAPTTVHFYLKLYIKLWPWLNNLLLRPYQKSRKAHVTLTRYDTLLLNSILTLGQQNSHSQQHQGQVNCTEGQKGLSIRGRDLLFRIGAVKRNPSEAIGNRVDLPFLPTKVKVSSISEKKSDFRFHLKLEKDIDLQKKLNGQVSVLFENFYY